MPKHPEIPPGMDEFFVKDEDGDWCFRVSPEHQKVKLVMMGLTTYRMQMPEAVTTCAAIGFYGWNKAYLSNLGLTLDTINRLAGDWIQWGEGGEEECQK